MDNRICDAEALMCVKEIHKLNKELEKLISKKEELEETLRFNKYHYEIIGDIYYLADYSRLRGFDNNYANKVIREFRKNENIEKDSKKERRL